MKQNLKVEICANSAISAINAQTGGADRVELCAAMPEGGTTPSHGEIAIARRHLTTTRLHVIIRPRGGDFLYNDIEQEIILHDIRAARRAGADGIAIGCLTAEGDVDVELMKKIMEESDGMSVTFHRAFDVCRDPQQALEEIIALGCDRILTSGCRQTAETGIPVLKQLVDQAAGRITIMPGCGVTPENIGRIAAATEATEFHLSARSSLASMMRYRNPEVLMGGNVTIDEYAITRTDPETVRRAIQAVNDTLSL